MAYCTTDDVSDRLTTYGVLFVADNDRDGTVEAGESTAILTAAVNFATNHVDQAVMRRIDPSNARSQGVAFLKELAIDIAVWRASGAGGREIPESIKQAAELAFGTLRGIRDGEPIPGLVLPSPNNASLGRVTRVPMVFNPKDK